MADGDNLLDIMIGATIKGTESGDMKKLLSDLEAISTAYESIADNQNRIDDKVLKDLISTLNGNPPQGLSTDKVSNKDVIDASGEIAKQQKNITENEAESGRRKTGDIGRDTNRKVEQESKDTRKTTEDIGKKTDSTVSKESVQTRKLVNEKIDAIYAVNAQILGMLPGMAGPQLTAAAAAARSTAILGDIDNWVDENMPSQMTGTYRTNAISELGLDMGASNLDIKDAYKGLIKAQLNTVLDWSKIGGVKAEKNVIQGFLNVISPSLGTKQKRIRGPIRQLQQMNLNENQLAAMLATGEIPKGSDYIKVKGESEMTELVLQQQEWVKVNKAKMAELGGRDALDVRPIELQTQYQEISEDHSLTPKQRREQWKDWLDAIGQPVGGIYAEKNQVLPRDLMKVISESAGAGVYSSGIDEGYSTRTRDAVLSLSRDTFNSIKDMNESQLTEWVREEFPNLLNDAARELLVQIVQGGIEEVKRSPGSVGQLFSTYSEFKLSAGKISNKVVEDEIAKSGDALGSIIVLGGMTDQKLNQLQRDNPNVKIGRLTSNTQAGMTLRTQEELMEEETGGALKSFERGLSDFMTELRGGSPLIEDDEDKRLLKDIKADLQTLINRRGRTVEDESKRTV